MKRLMVLAMLVAGCSGDRSCNDAFGQDCGATLKVTLLYATTEAVDAGDPLGVTASVDAGLCPPLVDGGEPACRCSSCTVTHEMPLAQYEQAVRQHNVCPERWLSPSEVIFDCVRECGGASVPFGASNTACAWAPALLNP